MTLSAERIAEIEARVKQTTKGFLSWFDDAYTHCQNGSQSWCGGYLFEAKSTLTHNNLDIPDLLAALKAEQAEVSECHKNIALKSDFIEATINDLAAKEAENAKLRAALVEAKSEMRDWSHDHPSMRQISEALGEK